LELLRARSPSQAGRPTLRPPVFAAPAADLAGEQIVLRGREGRHASTVRRLDVGERVDVTDGAGTVVECTVVASAPGELSLDVLARRAEPPPQPRLIVLQAIPKGDRGELAVELLTEVGADVIVPWAADRCVAVWRGERADRSRARWSATAQEAAKQSRRTWFPEVTGQADLRAAVRHVQAAALAIVLDPDADAPVASLAPPATGEIVLVVGPEGGMTPAEAGALHDAGAVPAALGPTVLRASTAGVVAASVLLSRTGRWQGRPSG
jgi:16S rRNA (uracil1498-N3)-methyltransferase